jgi:hypothetical protein
MWQTSKMRLLEFILCKLRAWLRANEIVEAGERSRMVTQDNSGSQPDESVPSSSKSTPDFAAHRKAIFGNRKVPGSEILREDRGRY